MYGWIITIFQQYLQQRFSSRSPISSQHSWSKYCELLSLPSSFHSIHRHDDLPESQAITLLQYFLNDLKLHHHIQPSEILEDIGALYLQTLIHEGYDNLLRCLGSSFDEWFTNLNKIHEHLETIYPNITPPEFWCVPTQLSENSHSSATERNEYIFYYSSQRSQATDLFLPMIRGIVREVAKEYFSTCILSMKLQTTQGIDGSPHSSWKIITMPLSDEPRISPRKFNPVTPSSGRCPFHDSDDVRRFSDNSVRSSAPRFFFSRSFRSEDSPRLLQSDPSTKGEDGDSRSEQPQDCVISSSQINGQLGSDPTIQPPPSDLNQKISLASEEDEGEELQRVERIPPVEESPKVSPRLEFESEIELESSQWKDFLAKPESTRQRIRVFSRFYNLLQRSPAKLVPVSPRSSGCPADESRAVTSQPQKQSMPTIFLKSFFSSSYAQPSSLPPPLSSVETFFLSLGIAAEQAVRLYPFHILFDIQSLAILSSGLAVSEYVNLQDLSLDELFILKQPKRFTWSMLQRSLAEEAMIASSSLPSPPPRSSIVITVISKEPSLRCPKDHKPRGFQLTGQVICSHSPPPSSSLLSAPSTVALFLANPHVTSISEMLSQGLSLFDLEEFPLAQSLVIQSEVMRLETMVSLQKEKEAELLMEASHSLANEMKSVATKAEEALDVKKIFVRTVSHEIRTPLTVAKMGLSLLERDFSSYSSSVTALTSAPSASPQQASSSVTVPLIQESLQDIQLSLDTAINILNDLLAYEKLESGILVTYKTLRPLRWPQSSQPQVSCYLLESIRPFRVQAKEKDIELVVEDCHEECFNESGGVLQVEDMLVHVDENKISQVIRNLLSNAIKFTPERGTVTVRFQYSTDVTTLPKLSRVVPLIEEEPMPTVGLQPLPQPHAVSEDEIEGQVMEVNGERMVVQRRGTLTVEFIDSGAGISPENQRKLFREIVQFSPDKLQAGGGSGLGLWISSGIIELHSGRIGVWSAGLGQGSTFYFSLPLYGYAKDRKRGVSLRRLYTIASEDNSPVDVHEDDEEEGEACTGSRSRAISISPLPNKDPGFSSTVAAAPPALAAALSPLHSLRILVVDDAPSIRKVVTRTLKSIGASCDSASDGQRAIDLVLSSTGGAVYDLILMDNIMVPMGGLEATREIRRLGYGGLIIGATGNIMPDDIQLFLEAGADDVLGKPLSLQDLESSVERLLQQRNATGRTPPTTARRRTSAELSESVCRAGTGSSK